MKTLGIILILLAFNVFGWYLSELIGAREAGRNTGAWIKQTMEKYYG